jgi:hypothetical protein
VKRFAHAKTKRTTNDIWSLLWSVSYYPQLAIRNRNRINAPCEIIGIENMFVEIIIYLIAAIGALLITGYAVHMFIGGLVSPEAEYQLIAIACLIIVAVIGYMTWDVIQRRSGRK